MLFAEGVPNACSAHLSLMLGVKGACQTIIGTRTAGLDALRLAALRIAGGDWDRVIVAAAEEYCDIINSTYAHCGKYGGAEASMPFAGERGFATGSAAVALILESAESISARGGRARGRVLNGASSRARSEDRSTAAREVLRRLGDVRTVLSSANGTRVDGAELEAIRQACPGALVSSVAGRVPETFSCGPLIGLAGTLLTGRAIGLVGDGLAGVSDVTAARGDEAVDSVVAICTDYAGGVSGIRVAVGP
jgi:3-oxoacyl-[acyl-carrier-protein] synthase II